MSASVFPARAGMSPNPWIEMSLQDSVPRASGDEPNRLDPLANLVACSPRERG